MKQMNKSIFLMSLIILVFRDIAFSFQTTSESVNPFNKYIGSGGENLFTGTVSYSQPLLTVTTRGNLSLPVALGYSSNVELNARADNQTAQTSWVGLGWSLGFGKIICEHNNTMHVADDEYIWISPEGVMSPLLYKNSKYYIKDRPYMKVERSGDNSHTYGWVITDESGIKFRYGDFNSAILSQDSLNWKTLCWTSTGYVGNGFVGEPVLNLTPFSHKNLKINSCPSQKKRSMIKRSVWTEEQLDVS